MSSVETSILVASLAAGISGFTAVLTYRAARGANQATARKVDLEEHRDAIDRLKKIIEEQDKHVERVRMQLDRVQEQLAREQDVSMALRMQIHTLQDQVDGLLRARTRLDDLR